MGKKLILKHLNYLRVRFLKGENRKLFETKKIKLDVLKSEKIIGLN